MSVLGTKLKTVTAATLAVATIAGSLTMASTSAEAYYRGRGAAIGLGIAGGIAAGALIAGAARPGYGYYDGPVYGGPAYVVDGPVCHWERQRVYLDDYTYKIRRVRVCD